MKNWGMSAHADDPDFGFFLHGPRKPKQARSVLIADRSIEWLSWRDNKLSFERGTRRIKEINECCFSPSITQKAGKVSGSFHQRLERDHTWRSQKAIIAEFCKKASNEVFSFQPDLSLTKPTQISREYLTRPIIVPNELEHHVA